MEEEFVGYGEKAAELPKEVTEVAIAMGSDKKGDKKPRKKRKKGKFIVIFASGYPRAQNTEAAEIEAIDSGLSTTWSADFKATARASQSRWIYPAKKPSEFFGPLEVVSGPFRRIAFIGHGYHGWLGLSGYGYRTDITLEKQDLDKRKENIDKKIKPKLLDNTTIDIYACSVAVKKEFMKAIANAFGCRVRGFDEAVAWCVSHDGTKITSRGRIASYTESSKFRSSDRIIPNCKDKVWKNIRQLIPPVTVNPE